MGELFKLEMQGNSKLTHKIQGCNLQKPPFFFWLHALSRELQVWNSKLDPEILLI